MDTDGEINSLRYPHGKTRIMHASADEQTLIAYAFAIDDLPQFCFTLPDRYDITDTFGLLSAAVHGNELTVEGDGTLFGGIVILHRSEK